jgi:ABC-type transport system substrate-binding protein
MTRRRFITLAGQAGAVTALGGLAAACQPGGGTRSPSPTTGGVRIAGHVPGPQPVSGGRRGGTLVAGYLASPDGGFDPATAGNWAFADWDASCQLTSFGGLYAFDGDNGQPVPNIAQDFPTVSRDGLSLTIILRPGIKFHNGRAMQADDVKYSLERLIPLPQAWGGNFFSSLVGWDALASGKTKTLEGLEVKDSRTVVFNFKQPDSAFLDYLSMPFSAPVPREEVERYGKDFAFHTVGFGPFKLESFDKSGQRAVFSRFDDYMYPGLPYLDEIEMRWGLNSTLMLQQLQSGGIDRVAESTPSMLRAVAGKPELEHLILKVPALVESWLRLYVNHPPLDDVRVRQALNWAVDRSLIERITAGASVGWGLPWPKPFAIPHVVSPYGYDPDKAKQLLAEAGVPDGFKATLVFSSDDAVLAQFVQQQLAQIGVEVSLEQASYGVLSSASQNATDSMSAETWTMDFPEATEWIDQLYKTRDPQPPGLVIPNPQIDTLLAQAKAEFDPTRRFEIYAQIEKLVVEEAPILWLASDQWIVADAPHVGNSHFRSETGTYYDRSWVST